MTNRNKGFTLIELLVVIAIIGLLASIVLVSLNSARKKARDAKRVADIKQIQIALEMYYNDNRNYPGTNGQWMDNGCSGSYTDLSTVLSPKYIATVPPDPLGNSYSCNWYVNRRSGQGYGLLMHPELTATYATDQPCYDTQGSGWYCIGNNY